MPSRPAADNRDLHYEPQIRSDPAQHHPLAAIAPHQGDVSEAPLRDNKVNALDPVSRVHITEGALLIKPSELTGKMFQANLHSPVTDLERFIEHLLLVSLWA